MTVRSSKHALASRRNCYIPRFEPLEHRYVLSCSVIVSGSNLIINGDRGDNVIVLSNDGTANAGNITGTCDGQTLAALTGGASGTTFINKIIINAGRGHDSVTYTLTGDAAVSTAVFAHLGQGNDRFTANLDGRAILDGVTVDIRARGGDGDDNLSVSAVNAGVESIGTGSKLRIDLDGNPGRDTINVIYQGEVDGSLVVLADGGPKDDTIAVSIQLSALDEPDEPGGSVLARVRGGSGHDNVTLNVTQDVATDAYAINARIDCHKNDNCTHTSNVQVGHIHHD
jgi:hypothetical protein